MTASERFADLTPSPAGYLKAAREVENIPGLRPLRLAVLATFTAEFLGPYLRVEGARRGFAFAPWFAPWGQLEEQVCEAASLLYAQKPEVVVIFAPEIDPARLAALLAGLRARTACPIFVANVPPAWPSPDGLIVPADETNAARAAICRAQPGVFIFDLARCAAEYGLRGWVDARLLHLARVPWSAGAQIAVARSLARHLRAAFVPSAKVLVLDLDGTLWGGVLGEDGLGGIALGDEYPGNVFKAFQRYLLALKNRGVLLALASKNNAADVDEVFARHADLVLHRADFAAVQIHWKAKSESLRAIAAELNVGLDALVFFDDSPYERAEVRAALPTVQVIEVPPSPLNYIAALEESECFDRLTLSAEDRQRTQLYQAQAERAAAQARAGTAEEFLRGLQLVATIGEVDADTLPRVAQLLAKTNQFNLTTRRHGAAEIQAMIEAGAIALWLRLTDRFGDHGLVGVAIAVREGSAARIDTLLLSCRVLGRGVETALLAELCRRLGSGRVIGEYLPTAKNAQVADFYPRHGFIACGENRWSLALPSPELVPPDFLTVQ
jgi:FkbH-like protein